MHHAIPLGQAPHAIINSHGGCHPSDTRIPRMLATEGVNEVDRTSRQGPQPPLYLNPSSREQMRLPQLEVVGGMARPLPQQFGFLRNVQMNCPWGP